MSLFLQFAAAQSNSTTIFALATIFHVIYRFEEIDTLSGLSYSKIYDVPI